MYDNYNYPAGADNANAPWNQPRVEERDFQIDCCQTLVRETTVTTTSYRSSRVVENQDGECVREECIDTSCVDWEHEYRNDYHLTPIQLINELKVLVYEEITAHPEYEETRLGRKELQRLRNIAKECQGWVAEDTEFTEV